MKPKRTDLAYLRGWFLPQAKGNHRKALELAQEYLREVNKPQ